MNQVMKWLALFLLIIVGALSTKAQTSVLSEGDWVRIGVLDKSIYRLTRSDLQSLGFNVGSLDPRLLQLYGNGGGGILPQANNASRPNGLQQNAILVEGENDGSFDSDDLLIFFGNSPDKFEYDPSTGDYEYEKNIYSDTTFYFLTLAQTEGMRVEADDLPTLSGVNINSFPEFIIHEIDQTNIISSGRQWVGETFNSGNGFQTFELQTPGQVNDNVSLVSRVIGRSTAGNAFEVTLDGQLIGEHQTSSYPDETYGLKGSWDLKTFSTSISAATTHQLRYQHNSSGTANLDYFIFRYERSLTLESMPLFFRELSDSLEPGNFQLSGTNDQTRIWNITNPTSPVEVTTHRSGGSSTFGDSNTSHEEYVAFNTEGLETPILLGGVQNQDLLSLPTPDAIFLTYPAFKAQADRLAEFRRSNDGLDVLVVTTTQVYNDFSSGMQDIAAIRDFVRHLYSKQPSKLKYLLLFGDGSYDYKKRTIVDHNFVPVYESRNSTDRINSHSSDDFFGFMEEDEGEWVESTGGDHTLEIGIGRLIVKSLEEAEGVVDKLIRYSTSDNALGDWRKKIYFLADDGDFNIHLGDAEKLSAIVDTEFSYLDINKIYVDAFNQESTGGRKNVPDATRLVQSAFDEGAFIINFSGHGNEGQWTEEDLLVESMIPNFTNRVKLPLLITATCEFGNYDNPLRLSGGEQMLLNPNGGAIALLTTTRPVYQNTNFVLNEAFYEDGFQFTTTGEARLGDLIRITKNNSLRGPVNRNFVLLGDPTMKLAFSEYNIELEIPADTLGALGTYTLSGRIVDFQGAQVSSFNGTVNIDVFDKTVSQSTLGDESQTTSFESRSSAIYRGEASVNNGRFDFSFVVPKNISYRPGAGKISLYAQTEDRESDANGASVGLIIGGGETSSQDTEPPEIAAFINTRDFQSGDNVGQSPILLIDIEDESGVSLTKTGIGQQLTAVLDGEITLELNDFYRADLDTYQSGTIRYPLGELEQGLHTLAIKIWDTHNNSSTTEVEFYVGTSSGVGLSGLSNYPNPMNQQTTITFNHGRAGEGLEVVLGVYSINGDLVFEREYQIDEAADVVNIPWDGRYERGSTVRNGIYVYKLVVQSVIDGAKSEAYGKLIIAN